MTGWVALKTAEEIRRIISDGRARCGGRLPSERELSYRLQVSRSTVRTALGILRDAGEVETREGRDGGTFVSVANSSWPLYAQLDVAVGSHDPLNVPAALPRGVDDVIAGQGGQYATQVLDVCRKPADGEVAEALGLSEGASVFEARRLRCMNGSPVALECTCLSAVRFPDLAERDLERSLYRLLADSYGVQFGRIEESIEVVGADAEQAQRLAVSRGSPLILSKSVALDAAGRPVECSHDLFRADRVRFVVEHDLSRPAAAVSEFHPSIAYSEGA